MRVASFLVGIAVVLTALSSADAYAPQKLGNRIYMATRAGLHDATLLIVRHGEKDGLGPGLSPAGKKRAAAYAHYFEHFRLGGVPIHIDALVASEDSSKSERPRLTLEPLSRRSGLVIYQPSPNHEVDDLVGWLRQRPANQTTLISWHHTKIPALLAALGIDPSKVLPNGKWPDDAFDWVVVLHFDQHGRAMADDAHLITEPDKVNNPVWGAMDHPTISPLNTPARVQKEKAR